MAKEPLFATVKGKITAILVGIIATAGIVGGVFLFQDKLFRSIVAEEISGTVNASGETKSGALAKGEHLYAGDYINVASASGLTLCADSTKYLYADQNTGFKIDGDGSTSKGMKIVMDQGSTLHEIKQKLSEGESYEVDTPNSTMSVRGTKFRVTVYKGTDGLIYTLLEVENGAVLARLKTDDGTYNGIEKTFGPGESALIRGNSEFSEFVPSINETAIWFLDYPVLPKDSVERLVALLNGEGELLAPEPSEVVVEEKSDDTKDSKKKKDSKSSASKDNSNSETNTGNNTNYNGNDAANNNTNNNGNTANNNSNNNDNNSGANTGNNTDSGNGNNTPNTNDPATHTHTPGEWEITVEAKCTTDGTRVKKCTSCNEIVETETIRATGHSYGAWTQVTAPDCNNAGSEKHVCANCSSEEERTVSALGHDYTVLTSNTPANCTTQSTEVYKCSRCDSTKTTHSTGALDHDWKNDQNAMGTVATCTTPGTFPQHCERCTETRSYEYAPALGHTPNGEGVYNDPDEPNSWCFTCANCGGKISCDSSGNY